MHVPSYGGIIWLKHKEVETLGIKGLSTSHVHGLCSANQAIYFSTSSIDQAKYSAVQCM